MTQPTNNTRYWVNLSTRTIKKGMKVSHRIEMTKPAWDIVECDIAPTNKGRCKLCRNIIRKGTPRLWYNEIVKEDRIPQSFKKAAVNSVTLKRLICHKCGEYALLQLNQFYRLKINRCAKLKKKFQRSMKGKRVKSILKGDEMLNRLGEGI